MSNFAGYLVRAYNGVILDRYLADGGYKDTPDQRQDKDSYRDGYGTLHRQVLPKVSTTLELTTLEGLNDDQILAFKDALATGLINASERKLRLTYWNSERMAYCEDIFYMPDMTFTISHLAGGKAIYNSATFKFIGYGESR
jgi:hypothetical protein